jgi:hypothetical protein
MGWIVVALVCVTAPVAVLVLRVCSCVGAKGVCWSWHRGMCDGAGSVLVFVMS